MDNYRGIFQPNFPFDYPKGRGACRGKSRLVATSPPSNENRDGEPNVRWLAFHPATLVCNVLMSEIAGKVNNENICCATSPGGPRSSRSNIVAQERETLRIWRARQVEIHFPRSKFHFQALLRPRFDDCAINAPRQPVSRQLFLLEFSSSSLVIQKHVRGDYESIGTFAVANFYIPAFCALCHTFSFWRTDTPRVSLDSPSRSTRFFFNFRVTSRASSAN